MNAKDNMKAIIEKIKNFSKNLTFEKSFGILVAIFLLSILLIAVTSPSTLNDIVTPSQNGVPRAPLNSDPYANSVDPNQLTRGRGDAYYYQYGQIVIEEKDTATYYYQRKPTDSELDMIKRQLGVEFINLVDETYKAVERTEPGPLLEPPTSEEEVILNLPRVGVEQSDEGIGPDAVVDGEE
jgi:hypothetical protein